MDSCTRSLVSGSFDITLYDDPTYTLGSADNVRSYEREYVFGNRHSISSRHGINLRESNGAEHSCVLLAGGGWTTIHEHSAVIVSDHLFVAVSHMLCALTLPLLELAWNREVDLYTCFGVHYVAAHNCLISHGEVEIARVSLSGDIVWSASREDIFTEGFQVYPDHVEAIDFNHKVYRIDMMTGASVIVAR